MLKIHCHEMKHQAAVEICMSKMTEQLRRIFQRSGSYLNSLRFLYETKQEVNHCGTPVHTDTTRHKN